MTLSTHVQGCRARAFAPAGVDESAVAALVHATGLSPIVARILVARHITDGEDAWRFLKPDLARDWDDPLHIPGMMQAAKRVARAVREGERIVVFGDFDLDGISSAAVAARGLGALGAEVTATVPHRFREGYGLTAQSVERLMRRAPSLVITVDCGVSSAQEVAELKAAGIDVVVTDHHEPGEAVPVDVAVANPKLDPACGSCDLAGAGVALKLVQAVGDLLGLDHVWREFTDLAMLGTVADMVPLFGENRALVADGLARTRQGARAGISALAAVASTDLQTLTSDAIAYQLAPRLNAAGRMADPEVALELLMTDDPLRAESLARELDAHNRARQAIEQDLANAATALAERMFSPGDRGLVLAGEGWHEGVKGIVASRLARRFGVPVVLLAIEGGYAKGSGRSAGSVDLHAAVSSAEDMLVRFGGHKAAVGLTMDVERIGEFRERFLAHLAGLPAEQFVIERHADAEIALREVGLDLAAEVSALEPFGSGNPRPVFCVGGVFMSGRERVGASSDHLRFSAYDGTDSVSAIAFRCADIDRLADHDAAVDLAFEVQADEWRGRKRVQMLVRDVAMHEHEGYSPAAEFVEDLFARADEILAREEYVGIEEAESFHTKLVGVTFEGRQEVVEQLMAGMALRAVREPDNPHDPNAIALHDPFGTHVGFFNRRLAGVLAPVLDAGVEYDIEVVDVTGGAGSGAFGVNILVMRRPGANGTIAQEMAARRREELAALPPDAADRELVREFLGGGSLHDAQQRALDELAAGKRCLTVMATGRGKSLIFHLHAARTSLREGGASVFVFPLRALVADQAFHLEEAMARVGIGVRTLTGESSPAARDEVFAALRGGAVDIVLTTPEFLAFHAQRFAATGRIRFAVVDEAHHVGTARAGHRPAYTQLGEAFAVLGEVSVLAVTATAGDAVSDAIISSLGITSVVTDPTVRENLLVEDRRGLSDKDAYLASLASRGEKVIVYVNSREQSVRLARMLRKKAPAIAMGVAFYNGGLARSARHAVERAFRAGELSVVVATSAFGEGVNIPDVRHVVLYHLPFNDIEFNQMCGRGGRDGAVARVHLLFGLR
ncbi:MAG: single-stranded-DNA-specific exonuclease RecJ, partial [Coriobacteriia bacterium]|nr:single-stranded-DNA-specific exonuclease RecJ [Coriobacteriia bacterium]